MLNQNYSLNNTQNNTMQLSNSTQWQGIVKAINHGNIVSEVTLEMAPNISVRAIVSKISVEALGLKVGGKACALIQSTEVTLAID
jgi:molybdate transport system regulatory protein